MACGVQNPAQSVNSFSRFEYLKSFVLTLLDLSFGSVDENLTYKMINHDALIFQLEVPIFTENSSLN